MRPRFYIQFHSYWPNSPSYFIGPFGSRVAAEAEVDRANAEMSGVNFARGDLGQTAPDIRHDMRIAGILTTAQARRAGMRRVESGLFGNTINRLTLSESDADVTGWAAGPLEANRGFSRDVRGRFHRDS